MKGDIELDSKYFRNFFSLENKVVIVDGGAGYIGSSISKGFVFFGANVIIVGRTKSKLESFIEENKGTFGNKFEAYVCDIKDNDSFEKIVKRSLQKYPNFSKRTQRAKFFDTLNSRELKSLKPLEPSCVVFGSRRRSRTRIVREFLTERNLAFVASANFKNHVLEASRFSFRKSQSFAKLFIQSSLKEGIRVNTISPGYFPKKKEDGTVRMDYTGEISKRVPMGRGGNADEITGAAIYLASDASSYITERNIVIDGGRSAW